jgi:hypothetical protein
MHIVDVLSRGFLGKRSPGVERAGDVYGPQDSAVAPGVETASGDSLEKGPSSLTIETPQPEGTVAGPFPRASFLSGGDRLGFSGLKARDY